MTKWKKLLTYAVLATLAVAGAISFYQFNGDSFDLSDRQVLLVVTDSMDGDVHEYDIGSFPADTLVMIEHLNSQEVRFLKVGDVISYKVGDILVQHRVVQVNSDSLYVHGDNNHSTEKVYFGDVNGKVVGTNWALGHVVAWIEGNFLIFLGMMFVLCSITIVLSMYPVIPMRKEEVD